MDCGVMLTSEIINSEQMKLLNQIIINISKLTEQGFDFYANENGNEVNVSFEHCDDICDIYLG